MRLLPLTALALALALAHAATLAQAASNTNQCLALLGGLQVCPTTLGLPTDQCCDALNAFNKAGCFYNPVMSTLAGSTAINQLRWLLRPICVLKAPLKWAYLVNPFEFTKKTYNGGTCSVSDVELDDARLKSALGFSGVLNQYSQITPSPTTCFDYNTFEASLAPFLTSTPTGTVGYGIGTYTGVRFLAEYLALYLPSINLNFWNPFNDVSGNGAILAVSPDGSSVILGGQGYSLFYGGCYNTGTLYSETIQSYSGCDTKIANIYIGDRSVVTGQPTGLSTLVSLYYIGAQRFRRFGFPQMCKFHTTHCAGTPHQQFGSEAECLSFLASLPDTAGNPAAIFSGNSTTCRFKHYMMAAIEPAQHCYHIGRGYADVYGHVKCTASELGNLLAYSDPSLLQLTASPAIEACIASSNAETNAPGYTFPVTKTCPGTLPSSPSGRRLDAEEVVAEAVAAFKARTGLRGAQA